MTMTNININLAVKLDGSETHMLAILVDSWGDKLVVPMMADTVIEGAEFFTPCAHCGNAVLECNFENGSDCCDRCNEGHASHFRPANKEKVDGKINYLKEDMTEEILETMDKCVHTKYSTCTGECWISDICTKRQELREYAIFQATKTQTLPEDVKMETAKHPSEDMKVVNIRTSVVVNQSLNMEKRIEIAREAAEFAFWDVIAKSFPEAVDGSFLMSDMEDIMKTWVDHWVDCNVPRPETEPCYRGTPGEFNSMHLAYEDMWYLMHTGGGCMAAFTGNFIPPGSDKHFFIGVNSECVCIYEDTFDQDEFMMNALATWDFGDNPTVLMNYLDEYLARELDACKMFDDIITIAKSGKC